MSTLEVSHLTKIYGDNENKIIATDHLSFTVQSGEFVAVVGRSGAGKTTLLNMLSGLEHPDSGSVILDGVEITGLSNEESAKLRRTKIGVIYQFYNLIPELNVRENITLPTELDDRYIDEDELASVISRVGLTGREHAYPAMLSGGQQQRAAIARALFSKPSLLLADEPTGNLDTESMYAILDLMKFVNREYGITIITVTHSNEIARAAGRIITISDGKIADDRRQ